MTLHFSQKDFKELVVLYNKGQFELLNPDVFVNMYQFWVRKI